MSGMGKVYEALKKAEVEGNPVAAWPPVAVNEETARAAKNRGNGGPAVDFINYSLNAADASEIEQRNRERAAQQAARQSLTQPAREVTLDLERISPHLTSFHDLHTSAAAEYNRLAITLMTTASERLIKRVLVASSQHGEGRTSVTLNLACALARAGRRVLVVDTDLQKPAFLDHLGFSTEVGLTDALANGLSAGAAVVRIQPFGFDLLPTREQVKHAAELLASPSFQEMMGLFDPEYDFILFDSPPLLTVADASLLLRHTDTTVLVIRAGKTSSGQVSQAIAPLTLEKILGVVLNRADRLT
jgi:capsular exopolysaccharide synthesis family protein